MEMYADRPLVTVGAAIEALHLPEALAERVRLRLSWVPSTPIIADPRNRFRIFLVAPPLPYHPIPPRLRTFLREHGVTVPERGGRIMLPTTDRAPGWTWVSEPEPGGLRLPHRSLVLAAVRLAILHGPARVDDLTQLPVA
ncbi:hypothetical protein ACFXHA_17410 [Nocardia sp. NPDC059240]|uniref:hypothetical protein n=1 Tax=Nocardia sp. NPDC059240 TaxID=3346786 RepID=UPI003696E6D4